MRAASIVSVSLLLAMGFVPLGSASEHPLVETCPGTEVGVIVNATDDVYQEICVTSVQTCEGSDVGVVINTTDAQQTVCVTPPAEACGGGDVGLVVNTPDGETTSVCVPPTVDTCDTRELGARVLGWDICWYPCIGNNKCLW